MMHFKVWQSFILLVVFTCFDYAFILGAVPLWVLLVAVGFIANFRVILRSLQRYRFLGSFVILAVSFSLYQSILDVYWLEEISFGSTVNLLMVVGFLVSMVMGSRMNGQQAISSLLFAVVVHLLFSIDQLLELGYSEGIINYFRSDSSESEVGNSFLNHGRISGSHVYVHYFSSIIGPIAAFTLAVWFRSKKAQGRFTWFIASSLSTALTVLTFTRSVLIGIFFSILISAEYKSRASIFRVILLGFLGFFFVGQFATGDSFEQAGRLSFVSVGGDLSSNDLVRVKTYEAAFEEFANYPFFGGGSGNYLYSVPPHNVFLKVSAYYGLIGFLLYSSMIYTLFLVIQYNVRNQFMRLALIIFLITVIVNGFFHTNMILQKSVFQLLFIGFFLGNSIGDTDER